jgi:hypothetical protein
MKTSPSKIVRPISFFAAATGLAQYANFHLPLSWMMARPRLLLFVLVLSGIQKVNDRVFDNKKYPARPRATRYEQIPVGLLTYDHPTPAPSRCACNSGFLRFRLDYSGGAALDFNQIPEHRNFIDMCLLLSRTVILSSLKRKFAQP